MIENTKELELRLNIENSKAKASNNGCAMERIIQALYPGAKFEYTGLIDLTINNVRVEIKSCQTKVQDSSTSTGRSGRFHFREEQHEALLEMGGEYIFLVHENGIPILYLRVPARKLDLNMKSEKAVCWKTIIQKATA